MSHVVIFAGGRRPAVHTEPDASFELVGGRAHWRSLERDRSSTMDNASVTLLGPDPAGNQQLTVTGWAAVHRAHPARWERWHVTLR